MKLLNVYIKPKYSIIYDVIFHNGNIKKRFNESGERFTRENAERLTGFISEYDQRLDGNLNRHEDESFFNPNIPQIRVGSKLLRYCTQDLKDMIFTDITNPVFGKFQTKTGINLSSVGHDLEYAKQTLANGHKIGITANVVNSDDAIIIDRVFAILEYDECFIYMGKNANYREFK